MDSDGIRESREWLYRLSDDEANELVAAASVRSPAQVEGSTGQSPFPLLDSQIRYTVTELRSGSGLRILRGVPVDRLGEMGVEKAFFSFSRRIGEPMEQPGGVRVAHVRSGRRRAKAVRFRAGGGAPRRGNLPSRQLGYGFRTTGELPFHGDLEDVIGFLCVRPAPSGGTRKLASAVTVYNIMREEHPERLRVLTKPFCMAMQFPHPDHGYRWTKLPFLSVRDRVFNACAYRVHIKQAQRLTGVPALTKEQCDALATFNAIADEVSVSIELKAGDMEFFNNHVVLHTRTEFSDETSERHLLRVWLSIAGFRTLHEEHPINLRARSR